MQIEVSGDEAVAIVSVSGRIDAYTAPTAEERLLEAVEGGRHLIIDLGGTDYISSAGLRVLITLAKRTRAGEFEMRLCQLQDAVREVFDIAGFTSLFEIRDSRDEALNELTAA